MKISTNWIKDYVEINEDLNVLADKITKCGINVESVESNYISNLKIGEIKSISNHPDSDHLNVCQVDLGDEVKQIVCGATNVREKLKVIVALEGAVLPGDFVIKKSTIRGAESNGMICALFELGLEDKETNYDKGICELDDSATVGMDAMEYLGITDTIYTLDLNPNRNDCLSHLGFAYEAASVIGTKVKMPKIDTNPINESVKDNFSLKIDTENCYSYNAKIVKDVVIGESPEFIKKRLTAVGMRSINNVVDISNYIMLEYGQPLHFFDKDKLGDEIVVRMAKDKEEITTLDDKLRVLTKEDIVITDGDKPVCIAGVMGGANTEIDDNTKNILIESAIFNPYNTRYTSINLNLRSEASLRYEKKLNSDYASLAIERACYLLEKYASGKVLKDTIVYNNIDNLERKTTVSLSEINSMLGMTLSLDDVIKSLFNLDFKYSLDNEIFTVSIPNRRMDVEQNSADIIEEIGRLYGYDKIEPVLPKLPLKQGKYIGNVKLRKMISKRLRSLGLNETRTYTLVSEKEDSLFNYNKGKSIELLRPLSADKKIIRQTLIPSLMNVSVFNKTHGVNDILIYEISNTYSDEYVEDTKVSVLLKGNYINNWNKTKVKVDFYLLKGILEDLLDYLGFKNRYSFSVKEIDSLHPGVSATILLDREEIGFIGKVHPNLTKEDIFVFEISMNKLNKKIKPIKHKEISKYPVIIKDVSFIVDNVTSKEIIDVIRKSGGRLLTDIKVFDLYVSDVTSIAYSLTFSDPTKTLTDEEVNVLFEKIMNDVTSKLNCKVKSI